MTSLTPGILCNHARLLMEPESSDQVPPVLRSDLALVSAEIHIDQIRVRL